MGRRRDSQRGDRGGGRRALANGATAVALPGAGGMAESSGWSRTGEESLGAGPTAEVPEGQQHQPWRGRLRQRHQPEPPPTTGRERSSDEAGDGPWLWVPATPAERGQWVPATPADEVVPSSVQLVVPPSTGRGGERARGDGSRSEESELGETASERDEEVIIS